MPWCTNCGKWVGKADKICPACGKNPKKKVKEVDSGMPKEGENSNIQTKKEDTKKDPQRPLGITLFCALQWLGVLYGLFIMLQLFRYGFDYVTLFFLLIIGVIMAGFAKLTYDFWNHREYALWVFFVLYLLSFIFNLFSLNLIGSIVSMSILIWLYKLKWPHEKG